jgi:hypothetical protein
VLFNTIGCSEPNGPATQLSVVEFHNNEPDVVVGEVTSRTTIPALAAPEPFNDIILSPISKVVELIDVVDPLTKKSPLTVRFEPVNSTAVATEELNALMDDEKVFNDDVDVSNEVNLLF